MLFGKILAVIILGAISIAVLRKWVLVPIGLFILIVLIRWIADLYWLGKDKGKW